MSGCQINPLTDAGRQINVYLGDHVLGDKSTGLDQRGQSVGQQESLHMPGGHYQPGWTALGDVYQAQQDVVLNQSSINQAEENLTELFFEVMERVSQLDANAHELVTRILEQIQAAVEQLQHNNEHSANQNVLEEHLKLLHRIAPEIGNDLVVKLASPTMGFAVATQQIAGRVLAGANEQV